MNKKPIFALKHATLVIAMGYSLIIAVMPFYIENLGAGGRKLKGFMILCKKISPKQPLQCTAAAWGFRFINCYVACG